MKYHRITYSVKSGLVFLGVILTLSAKAQFNHTTLYAKPYKDSIALRWLVYDVKTWEANIVRGYDIYRVSSKGEKVKINDTAIRALNPKEFVQRFFLIPKLDTNKIDPDNIKYPEGPQYYNLSSDSAAFKAMVLQFPKELGFDDALPTATDKDFMDFGKDPLRIRWMFHAILSLPSVQAAQTSGLYFMDKKVNRQERYTYYVTSAGEPMEKALAKAELSPSDPYLMRTPQFKMDFTNKKRSVLTWKKIDTLSVFIPSYSIYRSEKKNGEYRKMNEKPIIALYTGASQRDSTIVTYSDNTLEKEKVYYYKVEALDVFGDLSPLSEAWMVREKTLIEMAPYIEEARKEKDLTVSVKWVVADAEKDNVAFFRMYKSIKPDTLFKPIGQDMEAKTRSMVDKSPSKNNYYRLMTVGKGGDTLWATPAYVLIADTIPPAAPVMIKAVCDSNGIVTLTWKHNNEPDLESFKLFRGNYSHEELSRVAHIKTVDTIYRDTIELRSLSKDVYYQLLAYDDSYNPSAFSNLIKAKRYDIIPPNAPVIQKYKSSAEGIRLEWANSSSEDVVKTVLFRRLQGENTWHEHKGFVRDTAKYTAYTDADTRKGQWYEYMLQAYDDGDLISTKSDSALVRMLDDGVRKEITEVKAEANRKKKLVKITWEYSASGIEVFQLYRSKNNGRWEILKGVPSEAREWYDQAVGPGNEYLYRVKAIYKDGGESPFSKEIVIKF